MCVICNGLYSISQRDGHKKSGVRALRAALLGKLDPAFQKICEETFTDESDNGFKKLKSASLLALKELGRSSGHFAHYIFLGVYVVSPGCDIRIRTGDVEINSKFLSFLVDDNIYSQPHKPSSVRLVFEDIGDPIIDAEYFNTTLTIREEVLGRCRLDFLKNIGRRNLFSTDQSQNPEGSRREEDPIVLLKIILK